MNGIFRSNYFQEFHSRRGLQHWLALVAATGLCCYALLGVFSPDIGKKFSDLAVLLGSLLLLLYRRDLLRSVPVWLLLAAILIQGLTWGLTIMDQLDIAESSPKFNRLGPWFFLIPFAVLLNGNRRNWVWLSGCYLAGLLVAPWFSGEGATELLQGFEGRRIDLGLHNAQHTGMFYGAGMLLIVALVSNLKIEKNRPVLVYGGLAVLFLVCLVMVLLSQTRGVWLGLLVALFLMAGIWLLQLRGQIHWRKLLLVMLAMVLTVSVVMGLSGRGEVIRKRWDIAAQELQRCITDGEIVDIESEDCSGSVGVRLVMWSAALPWIAERPLLGWGGSGRKAVIESTSLNKPGQHFGHLHNLYVDTLVCYGLLGLGVLLGLVSFLFYAAYIAWQKRVINFIAFQVAWGFLAFWGVINLFESYLYFSSGTLVFGLAAGSILSSYWRAAGKLPLSVPSIADGCGEEQVYA